MTVRNYEGVEFYVELTRKGGKRTGNVLVVRRAVRNGESFACVAVETGKVAGKTALPVVTWTHDDYLARKCEKIDETAARAIDPAMMAYLDKHHDAAEFRLMHEIERWKPGRTGLQQVDDPGTGSTAEQFYELYGA